MDLLGRMEGTLDLRRRDEPMERFDLDPSAKGRTYSKGNRRQAALVAALASDVELLILDEPTAGLHPVMEATFRETITHEFHNGRTASSPATSCPRWRRGATGSASSRQDAPWRRARSDELRHLHSTTVTAILKAEPDGIEGLADVHELTVSGRNVEFQVDADPISARCWRD